VCRLTRSPVFGFTSKRGKLLLDMSTRIRCHAANKLLVVRSVIVASSREELSLGQTFAMVLSDGRANEDRREPARSGVDSVGWAVDVCREANAVADLES